MGTAGWFFCRLVLGSLMQRWTTGSQLGDYAPGGRLTTRVSRVTEPHVSYHLEGWPRLQVAAQVPKSSKMTRPNALVFLQVSVIFARALLLDGKSYQVIEQGCRYRYWRNLWPFVQLTTKNMPYVHLRGFYKTSANHQFVVGSPMLGSFLVIEKQDGSLRSKKIIPQLH